MSSESVIVSFLSAFVVGYYSLGTNERYACVQSNPLFLVRGTFGMIDEGGRKEMFWRSNSTPHHCPTLQLPVVVTFLSDDTALTRSPVVVVVVVVVPDPFVLSLIMP